MHIPDGLLPPSVCISGYAITGGLTWFSLRQIKGQPNYREQISKASLLTAAFFVATLIHIPIPPISIHLLLNGMMGIVLGYYAFPAILVALLFQAIFFQHGGLSTLGINAIIIGVPSLVAYHLWLLRKISQWENGFADNLFAFISASASVFLSGLIFVLVTLNNISPELDINAEKIAIFGSLVGYGIQSFIEGFVTVIIVNFLLRVKPEMLENN